MRQRYPKNPQSIDFPTAQEILDKYKFMENGVELFPRDATKLTREQEIKLRYYYHQKLSLKLQRKILTDTEATLEKLKDLRNDPVPCPSIPRDETGIPD